MALVVVALIMLLPSVLVTATRAVIRRRERRRSQRPARPRSQPEVTETIALRLLLVGAISKDEYRRSIATLAAYDELAHPVQVPLR